MTQKHPDFEQEAQRLAYTKHYMRKLLEESKRDVQSAQDSIRKSMADLEYLDSSLSYLNILTNARFFEMARDQKEGLEAVQQKPYFARIHFQKEGEPAEKLYIGKTSLFDRETQEPIIVDWRSPVANVYYDGRLGDLTYKVHDEEYNGHLFSKRQYKIEEGKLLDVQDIDLTTNDELLQDALAGKADVRLTEIVSTIQAEQNDVIRAHLKQPILVQGAAGSGKTTIALHRISYFLYTMGEHFNAKELMILAPNQLFIDYIGDVLPELGVDQICQTTYSDYVQHATDIKLKIQNPNEQLEKLVSEDTTDETVLWLTKMKGSLEYRDVMDRYLKRIESQIADQFEDVYIEKYRILTGSHLRKLFLKDFAYMPIEKRIERIKAVLQNYVRQKKKQILLSLNKRYDEMLDKALFGIQDAAKRKQTVTKWIDERDVRIPAVEKMAKSTCSSYMKRFKKHKIKSLYREFLTNYDLQRELSPKWSEEEHAQFFNAHIKETWALEDLAAIFYLHAKIKGVNEEWKMRVVFIDEVQDYSLFQLAALKEGLETDMFTMVGDLAQGIHSYRSLTDWTPVRELFPRATYKTLQKSYRTTIEIMAVANEILSKMGEDLPLVEPVVRHGDEPTFHEMGIIDPTAIEDIHQQIRAKGHRSIALICKTSDEAMDYTKVLQNAGVMAQTLSESSEIDQGALLVIPSHLAKGLEFDAVIVTAIEKPFRDTALDRKLLYVAVTRAMHELHLVGSSRNAFLLAE
ncbi:RNA polymerase recycling motor HelD [Viridibacillus sp. FSL R5-0477]|uniref:Superfamily I DNA helicase n=1 Tax=Viridibacillus arenosi FSL R5-213 TaxID=1227360 RepID=W4F396_9BACL|nr:MULTISPECIES: RNA polymerase recycling motor HelD [Viridibacillus]ETT87323.1 superfamily I DNA helicase [Viridibacillus arenosi FSL R5-213]OMC82396.1 DNA helicase [Viridibacillus sp. FSL H8-0123]OMC87855.1 DNA helicase [Viridibacillus sp. FSL H7-0596]OMC91405.1 DNA helicase [Viridibacillus arenosi]